MKDESTIREIKRHMIKVQGTQREETDQVNLNYKENGVVSVRIVRETKHVNAMSGHGVKRSSVATSRSYLNS